MIRIQIADVKRENSSPNHYRLYHYHPCTNPLCCNVLKTVCYAVFVVVCLCGSYCFTSTEARLFIRDGDRGGRGRESVGSTADTARKRPERSWTAARTTEVLRRCPLAIAQRLVHCAIAVSTAVLGQRQQQNNQLFVW